MIQFKLLTTETNILNKLQNKLVCDVTESKKDNNIYLGQYVEWRGSTENEYFLIMFVKGVLIVSVEEREFNLSSNVVNLAISEELWKLEEKNKNDNDNGNDTFSTFSSDIINYHSNIFPKEYEEINFSHIMTLLNWNCIPDVKVYHDLLGCT